MSKSWALSLGWILGVTVSLAYGETGSSLLKENQWEQGKRYLTEGKATEAKEIFEALTKKYPREPDLYLFLGIASLRLRDPQAAETQIKRVLSLDPDHTEARTLLGWVYLEVRRDFASAIDEYASMRLTLFWIKAPKLPRVMESADEIQISQNHSVLTVANSTRNITANAAAFGPVDSRATTGAGAPS